MKSITTSEVPLNIIYEDNDLLVINKPPGLVSAPSETLNDQSLSGLLVEEKGLSIDRGGLVHRLDKDTSGLILAAKNLEAFENLQAQFKSRVVKKEYTTLVHGFTLEQGEIDGPIARNPENREKFMVTPLGREARTLYYQLKKMVMKDQVREELFGDFNKIQKRKMDTQNYYDFSLLRCLPETGRTHQIRVHLKYINFPIVGDEKYGGRKTVRLDRRWCKRLFLHASKIEFNHPQLGEKLVFDCPLPEDLRKTLEFLENV